MATVNEILEHGGVHAKFIISSLLLILVYCIWSHFKAKTQSIFLW